MRNGSRIMACLLATLYVGAVSAAVKPAVPSPGPVTLEARQPASPPTRVLSFRSLAAQIDNQVIANLLTDAPMRVSKVPLSVVAGEVTRCESQTCVVPLMVRVADAQGPVTLAFAVANPKGELSEVQHTECGTGECSVALIMERGRNTISAGVVDGLTQTTAYTTVRVNAARTYAKAGRTEWF